MTHALVLLAAFVVGIASLAAPAAAQADDNPYGSTSTTRDAGSVEPECELDLDRGTVETEVVAEVRNVRVGTTVSVFVGGELVGTATAEGEANTTATVHVLFEVPDLEPGIYDVTAVGVDFTAPCAEDSGGFEILAAASATDSSGGSGPDVLALTGASLLILVVLGILLILVGRAFLKRRRAMLAALPGGS